jgi:hypothetical protein
MKNSIFLLELLSLAHEYERAVQLKTISNYERMEYKNDTY